MDRYADILQDFIDLAVAWKGESISTDEEELLGHLFRQVAYQLDTVNEKVQQIFDNMGISNNSGVPLANVLELIGMAFQSEAASTATVTCTVSKATTIPTGSVVRTAANVYFTTDEALVFVASGSDDVGVTCTVNGPNAAGIGEINTIVSSVSGWTAVTNAAAATPGRLQESSAEVKARHTTAVSTSGERDSASVSESVGNVSGVSAVLVDDDVYPVKVYVIGGDSDAVAEAIDNQLTMGILTAGTTSVDVYNETTKRDRTISYTLANNLDIYCDISIQTTATFPEDGDDQIKAAIVALSDSQLIDDDVIYLKIPGAVYQVPGLILVTAYIGTAPSPSGTSDITVSKTQRAVFSADNIDITHV
jgi:hypothetical protein